MCENKLRSPGKVQMSNSNQMGYATARSPSREPVEVEKGSPDTARVTQSRGALPVGQKLMFP